MPVKVPPFFPGPAPGLFQTTDFLTVSGAVTLCGVIERAWAKAGHPHIRAEVIEMPLRRGSTLVEGKTMAGVRIVGLRNGLPIEVAK